MASSQLALANGGGCREVTADGWIIGSFTDQTPEGGGKVYFFRMPAARKP